MKRKIIFFDRDGVINDNEAYYIYKEEDFWLNDGVIETLTELQKHGYEFIIVSNQSGIAKGIYSLIDVEKLHAFISEIFAQEGIKILEYYYCTHHPDVSLCLCRKPSPLLFEKAIARFNIDVSQSWMIGDQPRDIEAAANAGILGILIEPNSNLFNLLPKILQHD
jgi:D-glycero-D-manno-heptose 1,7-bisphosphate phosphatase